MYDEPILLVIRGGGIFTCIGLVLSEPRFIVEFYSFLQQKVIRISREQVEVDLFLYVDGELKEWRKGNPNSQ